MPSPATPLALALALLCLADSSTASSGCIGPAAGISPLAAQPGSQCPRDSSAISAAAADAFGNVYYTAIASRYERNQLQTKSQLRLLGIDGSCTVIAGTSTYEDLTTPCATTASFSVGASGAAAAHSALATCLLSPLGVALSSNGDVVLPDTFNNRVLRISASDGSASVLAGASGAAGYCGDGPALPAASACFNLPAALALDGAGNVLVADSGNGLVRRIAPNQTVSTILGTHVPSGCNANDEPAHGGPASSACLLNPSGIAVDGSSTVVADTGHNRLLRVLPNGTFVVLVNPFFNSSSATNCYDIYGAPQWCCPAGVDEYGSASRACLVYPRGLSVDATSGDILVTDNYYPDGATLFSRVRRIFASNGTIATLALVPALPLAAPYESAFSYAADIMAMPSSASLLLADGAGGHVLQLLPNNVSSSAVAAAPTTLAQTTVQPFCGDGGSARSACLNMPGFLARGGPTNDLFIADAGNHRVRRVLPNGTIVTLAGGVAPVCDAFGSCACNASSSASGDGIAATLACIGSLQGLAVTATGEVIFADAGSHRVRRVDAAGVITTLAGGNDGSRVPCSDPVVGGPATAACFSSPVGVSISATDGSVWVTDAANDPSSPGGQYVWRVNSTVTSPRTFAVAVAGNGTACAVPSDSNGDGGPATLACLYQPGGIVVAQGGNITFVDAWNNKIRRLYLDGSGGYSITTVAGDGGASYSGDGGPVLSAEFNPDVVSGIDIDTLGNIVLSDTYNNVLRLVTASTGIVTTLAGSTDLFGDSGDGSDPLSASFEYPTGVAFDVWGNVDFADQYANRVRAVVMSTSVDCPAGYTCACAAPVPCTATSAATSSSASYCPANSVTPVAVTPGYVALANSAGLLVSQGACPIGTYCLGGILTQCPPGTYGTAPRQVLPSACVPCPAGTFSVAMGATGSSSCSPCPARTNTTTAISGGAPGAALSRGAGFCPWWPANVASVVNGVAVPCAEGTFAFPGPFGGCLSVPNPESIGVTDGTAVSAQFPPTVFVTRDASSVPLQVTAAVPIAVVFLMPAVVGLLLLICIRCCACLPSLPGSALVRKSVPPLLRSMDQMGDWKLGRTVGGRPVHWVGTEVGGAFSCAAIGVILAFSAVIIVQYFGPDNEIVSKFVLPARVPSIEEFAGYPFTNLTDGAPALAAMPLLSSGLIIQVALMGSGCGTVVLGESDLAEGELSASVSLSDSVYTHTFACEDCAFGPLSALNAAFNGTCQSLALLIGAVGAQGSVTAVSYIAQPPPGEYLSRVGLVITPSVEVLTDGVKGVYSRGYLFTSSGLSSATVSGSPPTALQLTVSLPAGGTYSGVEIVPKFGPVDLIYQLLATLAFGSFFTWGFMTIMERWKRLELLEAEKHAQEEAEAAAAAAAATAGDGHSAAHVTKVASSGSASPTESTSSAEQHNRVSQHASSSSVVPPRSSSWEIFLEMLPGKQLRHADKSTSHSKHGRESTTHSPQGGEMDAGAQVTLLLSPRSNSGPHGDSSSGSSSSGGSGDHGTPSPTPTLQPPTAGAVVNNSHSHETASGVALDPARHSYSSSSSSSLGANFDSASQNHAPSPHVILDPAPGTPVARLALDPAPSTPTSAGQSSPSPMYTASSARVGYTAVDVNTPGRSKQAADISGAAAAAAVATATAALRAVSSGSTSARAVSGATSPLASTPRVVSTSTTLALPRFSGAVVTASSGSPRVGGAVGGATTGATHGHDRGETDDSSALAATAMAAADASNTV